MYRSLPNELESVLDSDIMQVINIGLMGLDSVKLLQGDNGHNMYYGLIGDQTINPWIMVENGHLPRCGKNYIMFLVFVL